MGLNIALVGDVPTSLPMSGPQRTTKGLAEAYTRKGHEVMVVNYAGNPGLIDCNLKVFENDISSHHLSMLTYQRQAQRWLKQNDFDVVHWWRAFVPWPDIRFTPDVISFHGVGVTHRVPDHWKAKAALAVTAGEKVLGSHCAHAVTDSTRTKIDAERLGAKIEDVIPVGIEQSFLQEDDPIPDRVLYVSRINDKKNQRELVEASLDADWEPRLVGPIADDEYAATIPDLEKYYVGKVSEEELLEEYARADVYVLPSKHEGFGLTGLEAMAAWTPLVTSSETGICDVVDGTNGYVYELGDTEDLRATVDKCLSNRDELSPVARTTAEVLLWDEVADKYIDTYNQVIS